MRILGCALMIISTIAIILMRIDGADLTEAELIARNLAGWIVAAFGMFLGVILVGSK